MSKQRRTFERDRKAGILKRYLVDKVPISDLCDEYGITPNHIYNWQKILFDNAEAAFEKAKGKGKSESAREEKVHDLEAKLQQKNEVIAELLQEHVQLKKSVGEP